MYNVPEERSCVFRTFSSLLSYLSYIVALSIAESFLFSSGTVAAFLAILTLLVTGEVLSPSVAFVVLSFLNLLRVTLSLRLNKAIPLAFELFVSFSRIERFLLLENMPLDQLQYYRASFGPESFRKTEGNTFAQVLVRNPTLKNDPTL